MNENPQVQEQVTKVVTPIKQEEVDDWGFYETDSPIGEQENSGLRKCSTKEPEEPKKRSWGVPSPDDPKRRKWAAPRTPATEEERIRIEESEKSYAAWRAYEYESDKLSFFDERWIRTVYWDRDANSYKPRDPSKPVVWNPPEGWKPETEEERAERTKFYYPGGTRLYHSDALPGAIYRFFEGPDYPKVRVTHTFRGNGIPHVLVRDLDGSNKRFVLADELEATKLNSARSRKNWIKRQKSIARKNGVAPDFGY